jgi:DNA invertase Pin-like site-specific DNA recombinase
MNKCVLLIRVSTISQDLDQQTVKVREAAINDGYSEENIIVIEDKESATKLSEEERSGLNKLKHYIDTDPEIDAVYSYEISRISRRAQVVYSIRDYLIKHKVQLVVLNPYFKLLKDDGTISETANIFFGIFSSLAENEGYLRVSRILRGKEKRRKEGKLTCGIPLFGYSLNPDKTIRIDPEKSDIVREIYRRYLDGETCGFIGRDLWQRGVWSGSKIIASIYYVSAALRESRYKGEGIYPRIISDEDWNKCESMRKKARGKIGRKSATKGIYLCHGLLYTDKGFAMTPSPSNNRYSRRGYLDDESTLSVNMDTMDRLTSYVLHNYINSGYVEVNQDKERDSLYKESEIIKRKLAEAEVQKDKIAKENKMINQRIIKGRLSESEGDKMIDDNQDILASIEEMEIDLNSRLNEIINRVIFINSFAYDGSITPTQISPEKEQELLRQYCKKIIVSRFGWGRFKIVYEWKTGITQEYSIRSSKSHQRFYDKDGNPIDSEILKKKWRSV